MEIALGIDTGGTYTDGVVMDVDEGVIYDKAKALTTRQDLSIGINECINNLEKIDFNDIKMVSLSTTLATNATVEGQGCEVGLILIGFEPDRNLPTEHVVQVKGGHNIKGKPKEELDLAEVKEVINSIQGKVDAFAVSGYLSVRNPEHEEKVKELVQELTDYPVVCGHELTSSLGMHERTSTAVLNARLIPIIAELIDAVKKSMADKKIDAPLMIVKGDGSLVGEEIAREKPIETVLSGPASSLIGATYLTDIEDGVVVDMGGTTTDVALLEEGRPSLNQDGAMVGGWLTRVQAVDIATIGIGGDSYVQVSKDGLLQVGPQRVFPLSWIVEEYEHLGEQLFEIRKEEYFPINSQPFDILTFIKEPLNIDLTRTEAKMLDIIKEEPQSLYHLGKRLDKDPNLLPWERLVNVGSIHRASLTPTDILHAAGRLDRWDKQAAKVGVEIAAKRYNVEVKDFIEAVYEEIYYKIALVVTEMFIKNQGIDFKWQSGSLVEFLLEEMFKKGKEETLIDFSASIKVPIIAIGAPVEAYFPQISKRCNTSLEIPEHSEVANAVGTVTSKVIERIKILIKPGAEIGYVVHAPWEAKGFVELEKAVDYAKNKGEKYVRQRVELSGVTDIKVMLEHEDVYSSFSQVDRVNDDLYLESRIEIVAMGRPKLR
ncbi:MULTISPECIES: hydantoinase/oxoprolinase family protein [unclassified Candidatus Frackibacter]|uniref:hydantoinase/oxoprolinase family protein n=1 Tax=unclassified Candidatus Frackibacter TaxID=2648818 RepID=UPI000798E370|nr:MULTISPECIES: hydantoinase/oxoprolinase family protein [unclassified Candidatus Frackibacter]KXS40425.1 MAG: hydantoinase/oxoprolinase [Candidatus Frackibacter sp. T328-2]SDC37085.1 N-methylhydantoinase A/oxoprolinase/acetone carboxylase, beta subunit [Candidatus Frackibacter sp. WG11]SEM62905.1 N-methylhydantoinase A/oxoprolinase/acetone carboxylase, beta subunit [Candidatus Frackibacter sp. WG12]SFL64826.1 N-methylhydantoinase A/oxoprolinase/acetone carboxylase, beta subunit [Candidatus Fr